MTIKISSIRCKENPKEKAKQNTVCEEISEQLVMDLMVKGKLEEQNVNFKHFYYLRFQFPELFWY
jgi:hypothetical protein